MKQFEEKIASAQPYYKEWEEPTQQALGVFINLKVKSFYDIFKKIYEYLVRSQRELF